MYTRLVLRAARIWVRLLVGDGMVFFLLLFYYYFYSTIPVTFGTYLSCALLCICICI